MFTTTCKKGDDGNTPPPPTEKKDYLETSVVSDITINSALSGGVIHGNLVGTWLSNIGVCSSTSVNPIMGQGYDVLQMYDKELFTTVLCDLIPDTKYYIRAHVTGNNSIIYGNEISFMTSKILPITFNPSITYGSMSDQDGNTYKTVTIGTQTWMAENLKTTKYNDGTSISYISDADAWYNTYTPAYCWYNNSIIYKSSYGALYNGINLSKISPTGWHIPTKAEWNTLVNFLGGETIAQGKLKEKGTSHWLSPNTNATNESGFTALPGSIRRYEGDYGQYGHILTDGFWWSSDYGAGGGYDSHGRDHKDMYAFTLNYLNFSEYGLCQEDGASIRCVKDFLP